ncbi:MAG: c-type cytochrome [Luteibaculaceae bacterium]
MKKISFLTNGLIIACFALTAYSCSKDPNSPGYEYMPDMYRGPAVEAYVDYGVVKGKEIADLKATKSARYPATGTIPFVEDEAKGAFLFPYPFENNFDGYEQAGREYKRPFEFDEAVLAKGKRLYENFCQQCHGKEGAGDGPTVTAGGYPAPPAYTERLIPEGKMFHTITYGKGVMGPHASLLTKQERWEVISYVIHLQDKALKAEK